MSDAERLKSLAMSCDRDGLEEAWLEALENPGPPAAFLGALNALPEDSRPEASQALLPLSLETYMDLGRDSDALPVARRLADFEPGSRPLRRTLLKLFRSVHKGESWLEVFLRSSGLEGEAPLQQALRLFDRYEPYKPGLPVEHKAGWGPGVVDGYNDEDVEVRVRFHNGLKKELPLSSALDSLEPMDPGDLRAMLLTDPEGLRELAQSDPGLVVRKAVVLNKGKATASQVKTSLVDKAVPAQAWARWWTLAKKAAAHDPYLKVEGGSRPVFSLRKKPVSMSEASLATVCKAPDLAATIAAVRSILPQDPDKVLLDSMLDEIAARLENGETEMQPAAGVRLDAALLLEEHGREAPTSSAVIFHEAASAAEGGTSAAEGGTSAAEGGTSAAEGGTSAPVELLDTIPGEKGRKLGLQALIKAFPEEWPERLAEGYHFLPRDLLTPAADVLIKAGHGELLSRSWWAMESEPWKYTWPLFHLARKVFSGELGGERGPAVSGAVLALLRCLEAPLLYTQYDKYFVREVAKRYEELLLNGRHHVLERFIDEGDRPLLVRAYEMIHATSRLPRGVIDRLSVGIPARLPDLKKAVDLPFWEQGGIFCSRRGIARRQSELREILEVKLPANAKAIGKAADFGDLSENAEWTAAIEEQRLLTGRGRQMETELLNTRALEDQILPEGVVAPGTRVTYREMESGRERIITILGPWDTGEDDVISYQAPLAAGLLGLRAGEEAVLRFPGGEMTVTVIAVEPAF